MKSSQRNADLGTLAYPTLRRIAWKWKKWTSTKQVLTLTPRHCQNLQSQSQCQSHFFEYEVIETTQSQAGLHFDSLPHVQILNGRKPISCEESKHAPFICWLIYIVYIYRQQNLHFPTTFISIDTWCPISIKSDHRILVKLKYQ